MDPVPSDERALLLLLRALAKRGYRFVTPTPATHRRVLARAARPRPRNLRDVFGWSRPFSRADLDAEVVDLMERAGVLADADGELKSRVRVSSLGGRLFLHSAYPPTSEDAVFFGPDSYRFAAFIEAELPADGGGAVIADIGAGAGVGGLVAAGLRPDARAVLTDVNAIALRYARVNAAFAGVTVETVEGSGLDRVRGGIDVALANPPYIIDSDGRTYREGGGMLGAEISLDWTRQAAARLNPGGRLLMYTGSAIVDGEDAFRKAAVEALEAAGCAWSYREIDPDVFGGELERPEYAEVERIAVVGLTAAKRS